MPSFEADIFVRFTVAGFHCWPGAKGRRSYLAKRHRHLFYVEVSCPVSHNDREIEFHNLLDEAKALLGDCEFGPKSCEAITELIGEPLAKKYKRSFRITVTEDNECGATKFFIPHEITSQS